MKSRESELLFMYLFFDTVILSISIEIAHLLHPIDIFLDAHALYLNFFHANLAWFITYFVLAKKNLYLREGYLNRAKRVTSRVFIFVLVALILAYFMMPRTTYSRVFLLIYSAVFYLGELIFYYCLYHYMQLKRKKGIHVNNLLILGANRTGLALRQLVDSNPMLGYKFVGFVTENEVEHADSLGDVNDLEWIVEKHNIEMVFVTLALYNDTIYCKEFLRLCSRKGVRLRFVPENQHWYKNKLSMESIGRLVLINPQEIPLDLVQSQFFKRLFDVVFSALVIVLLMSWLVPLVGIISKLTSKGPVFFVQQRTGINNRVFKCLKFRSMEVNEEADKQQASTGDARITRFGRFLRKTNFDELPQFFNVLVGDMSVVGPWPHMLVHTHKYKQLIDHYLVRHYVKPGITGWAQVNGYRGETDELWKMSKRVEYDMEYLVNWSFVWDMEIIAQTLLTQKAYINAV
jgi:putative colanic acid biosynthesis UDP-glucose lipid carrier transferase